MLRERETGTPVEAVDDTPPNDVFNRFVNGGLGKDLGLTSEQLAIGLSVAKNHIARGAPAEALRVYVSLVLCEPLNVDFQVGLSNCASMLGEHHVALQAASAVIALAPADPRGYLLSGRSCMMIGAFEEATEDLADAERHATAAGDELIAGEAAQLRERLTAAMAS